MIFSTAEDELPGCAWEELAVAARMDSDDYFDDEDGQRRESLRDLINYGARLRLLLFSSLRVERERERPVRGSRAAVARKARRKWRAVRIMAREGWTFQFFAEKHVYALTGLGVLRATRLYGLGPGIAESERFMR